MGINDARAAGRRALGGWTLALAACSGGERPAREGPPIPPPPTALPRIGVLFGEPFPGYEEALRAEAVRIGRELDVRAGFGQPAATEMALLALVDARVEAIVFFPSAPALAQRALALARERSVPLLFAMRTDGRSGPWAGVDSAALAEEAGARIAAVLAAGQVATPSIVIVEDRRWPESRRRSERMVDAIEQRIGRVTIEIRHPLAASTGSSVDDLVLLLRDLDGVDALLAGDPQSTAVAFEARSRMGWGARCAIGGISDDARLHEAARAEGSRMALIAFEPAAAAAAIGRALEQFATHAGDGDRETSVAEAVACELIGLPPPPRADGS